MPRENFRTSKAECKSVQLAVQSRDVLISSPVVPGIELASNANAQSKRLLAPLNGTIMRHAESTTFATL